MAAARARSVADGPAQGQNRATASAVTWPISAAVAPRASTRAEARRQADDLEPLGWRHQQRPVRSAGDAEDRQRPAPGACQRQHATGHLAVERRRVEVALARHHQVGAVHPPRQGDEAGHEVETRLDPGAQRDEATGQPSGRAGTDHARHVDAGLALVARGDLDQAAPESLDLRGRGALLGAEHRGGFEERRGHVARHDQLDPAQRLRRAHGVERALPPVGRGRTPAADHDAARPGVAGRHEELSDAGRVGADGIVTMRPWQQAASRRTGHLDDRRRAVDRLEHAPFRLDRPTERPADDGGPRRPAQRVEETLAAVGHRDLVGRPAGTPGGVGRRGRRLCRRHRSPELVRSGDEVGHGDEASQGPHPLA